MANTFKQSMPPDMLAGLPPFAEYEGDDPSLTHLRGYLITTVNVEAVIPIGEREAVVVEDADGRRWYPWTAIPVQEFDEAGKLVSAPHEPFTKHKANAMSMADLNALGFTDVDLDSLAREHLGEPWQPDRPGPSDRRREMFDRVMQASFG